MNLYQYNVYTPETFNASGKAKKDVTQILRELNIKDIYNPSSHRIIRIIQQFMAISKIHSSTVVFVQYPAVIDSFIIKLSKKKGVTLVGIIHDLESIREKQNLNNEISVLNKFDFLVSHNSSMSDYLFHNKCSAKIINLGIFDYLHDKNHTIKQHKYSNNVSFAGNLDKSEFLKNIKSLSGLKFILYGINENNTFADYNNCEYKGKVPSDIIPYELEGSFGLVWDGDSINTCDGEKGNYLKYNNPHKLSLYVASGMPVIVWSKSAVAPFVEDYQIGITVDSLLEAQKIICEMSEDEYNGYVQNISKLKPKLAEGYYMKNAVESIINEL